MHEAVFHIQCAIGLQNKSARRDAGDVILELIDGVVFAHGAPRNHILNPDFRSIEVLFPQRKQVHDRPTVSRVVFILSNPNIRPDTNALGLVVPARAGILLRKLLRLRCAQFSLPLNSTTQSAKLFVQSIEIFLPLSPMGVDSIEELISQRLSERGGKVGSLKLLQNDLKQVEVRVSKLK